MEKQIKGENTDLIIGRNAVSEALRSGRSIDTLLVIRGERNGSVGRIIAECKEKGIVVKEVDKKKLDFMCPKGNHQGVVAYAAVHEYSTVEDIFALAELGVRIPSSLSVMSLKIPITLAQSSVQPKHQVPTASSYPKEETLPFPGQ